MHGILWGRIAVLSYGAPSYGGPSPSQLGVPRERKNIKITQTTPYDSQWTLDSFLAPKYLQNSDDVTPNGGIKYRWGGIKLALFIHYRSMMRRSALSSSLEQLNHTSSNFSVPSKKYSDTIFCPPIFIILLYYPTNYIHHSNHSASTSPPASDR